MDIATMTDTMTTLEMSVAIENINNNLELFILLFVMFKCIELVRMGFTRLYKKKGE